MARLDTLEAKLSSLRFASESSRRRDGRPRSMAGHFEIYRSVAYWQHVNTLLDVEGSNCVQIDQFVMGCMRLRTKVICGGDITGKSSP